MNNNSTSNELSRQIRPTDSVAVLCVGEKDGLPVIKTLIELGITPILYTFYLKNKLSEDLIGSRKMSKSLNLQLVEVEIDDSNIEQFKRDAFFLMNTLLIEEKKTIQCVHPFMYVAPFIVEKVIVSGLRTDDFYDTFGLEKHRGEEELRQKRPYDSLAPAYPHMKSLFELYGKKFIVPKQPESFRSIRLELASR